MSRCEACGAPMHNPTWGCTWPRPAVEPTSIKNLLDREVLFVCVDCDAGDLNKEAARFHADHEGHCVVALDD